MTDYRISHDLVSGGYYIATIRDGVEKMGTHRYQTQANAEAGIATFRREDESAAE
jgi:hypothetical protein